MRVLVTGANGFVGRHLVSHLRARGCDVLGADGALDVTDVAAVDDCLGQRSPDAVVHLAALSFVPDTVADPALASRVNFMGTRNVLDGVRRRAPAARVLLAGSGDQYGSSAPGSPAFTEDAPFRPRSPYARTKAAADLLGAEYARGGLQVVRARAFNHTGPGQADLFVLSSFARQATEIALGTRAPKLSVGNLDSQRDFLDVADVLDAYERLLSPDVPPGAYNIASGTGYRVGDLLDRLLEAAGVRASIETDPERFRPTDFSCGDATRLRETTGWRPRIPIQQTLASLIADWRTRLAAT